NGKKAYEWHYDETGKRTGEQKYYHPNGELQYSGKWENGEVTGEIKVFDEKGNLAEKRQYDDGEFRQTIAISDQPTNAEENDEPKRSPFHGTGHYTLKSLDGKTIKEGYFRGGQLQDGKHFIYDENDSLIETRIVENGRYSD
ncbi:MAG: toxin-antitoxin system YwqK family antitoxin, partial [Marinilabilia sp.]